jgi:hypothetical protein
VGASGAWSLSRSLVGNVSVRAASACRLGLRLSVLVRAQNQKLVGRRVSVRKSVCHVPSQYTREHPKDLQHLALAPYMLRETDGTWDNGYTHAWTQVRAALRPHWIVHRKAPRVCHGARPRL